VLLTSSYGGYEVELMCEHQNLRRINGGLIAIKALIKLNISEYAVRLMLICSINIELNLVNNQNSLCEAQLTNWVRYAPTD
jgi:hypothetical protein